MNCIINTEKLRVMSIFDIFTDVMTGSDTAVENRLNGSQHANNTKTRVSEVHTRVHANTYKHASPRTYTKFLP